MLQKLSACEVSCGAAQGVTGGDEGLPLHHVRHGDTAAGIVHLGGREEGVGGGLQQLNEVDGRDGGGKEQQHRLEEEGESRNFEKQRILYVLTHSLEEQQHHHLHKGGDEEGHPYAAAVAPQRGHHLNEIVLRHGVEHGKEHHPYKGETVPAVLAEELPHGATLSRRFFLLLTAQGAEAGIAQHHHYISHQQGEAHPDHPLNPPPCHQLADEQGRQRISQRPHAAAEAIIDPVAVFGIGDAQGVHQGHHGIQGKHPQKIYHSKENAGQGQQLHHAEAEDTHRRQRRRQPFQNIAACAVGEVGKKGLGGAGEEIAHRQHRSHCSRGKSLTQQKGRGKADHSGRRRPVGHLMHRIVRCHPVSSHAISSQSRFFPIIPPGPTESNPVSSPAVNFTTSTKVL